MLIRYTLPHPGWYPRMVQRTIPHVKYWFFWECTQTVTVLGTKCGSVLAWPPLLSISSSFRTSFLGKASRLGDAYLFTCLTIRGSTLASCPPPRPRSAAGGAYRAERTHQRVPYSSSSLVSLIPFSFIFPHFSHVVRV